MRARRVNKPCHGSEVAVRSLSNGFGSFIVSCVDSLGGSVQCQIAPIRLSVVYSSTVVLSRDMKSRVSPWDPGNWYTSHAICKSRDSQLKFLGKIIMAQRKR